MRRPRSAVSVISASTSSCSVPRCVLFMPPLFPLLTPSASNDNGTRREIEMMLIDAVKEGGW